MATKVTWPSLADQVEPKTQAFIGGDRRDALSGETFPMVNPATGEERARVAACGAEDIDAAVESARAVFDRGEWANTAPYQRKLLLLRWADMIESESEELAVLMTLDM